MAADVVLSATIMAHPRRRADALALRARHPEMGFTLALDPDPGGPSSALRTARVAWGMARADATHHLVVQDDARLCAGFLPLVRQAIGLRPRDAICLFTEWGSDSSYNVRLAALGGSTFAQVVDHYIPTVALVLPADAAREFAGRSLPDIPEDDIALRHFLDEKGLSQVVLVPNLVDHLGGESLRGNAAMGERRAACFLPAPRGTGWSRHVVAPAVLPVLSTMDGGIPRCLVRGDHGGWARRDAFHVLRSHGVDAQAVISQGKDVVEGHAGLGQKQRNLFFGLWLTGYSLGLIARTAAHARSGPPAGPEVTRSLESASSGILRTAGDQAVPQALRTAMADGVRRAWEAGHA
ncbi:hypothetical protein [Nonomuraea sp. NPDC049607]|uniref:hypothetical protein n=1 Tax=Nonomuraea sp. NPDC049607 TaxID=3154732 RepID=UPI00341D6EEB